MEFLSVIVAAAGSFIFGAVWYMALAKPWMAASGVEVGADGQPTNGSDPLPYILSAVTSLLVAGMMRYVFAERGIETILGGIHAGFGVGLFFITPWLMMTYAFEGRPFKLTLINGGYATIGCAIIGAILALF
ncbi:MAG: DUF1761 domain-containing protein [Pseudomonadota bacterium]